MNIKLLTLFLSLSLNFSSQLFAVCPPGNQQLKIIVKPDNYPGELSWTLYDAQNGILLQNGTLQQAVEKTDSFCVMPNTCYKFVINDTYGDGICCAYGTGYYVLVLDGDTIATGGDYDFSETTLFNCPPGLACNNAVEISANNWYTAPQNDYWYAFTPTETGLYNISTCDSNTCDTKLWVYDYCTNLTWDQTNISTLAYNDNYCGLQSSIGAQFLMGTTYYIRIGSVSANCTGPIKWHISDPQPIIGCTNPSACNYNPMATISDSSCIYPGNPNCPNAPDLVILQNVLQSSMYVTNTQASNCDVQEQCLSGFGNRRIIRFTTHIKNIGELPYFIGSPSTNPDQFSLVNCHNHAHYVGYAEYVLYDLNGQAVPVGFKNGFCVLDLECSDGGTATYSCGNMGISPGCGDIYSSGLSCQWIDITDVDTGAYTFVTRVNWDQSPDALGNVENDYSNNWAQVCIRISYDTSGNKVFSMIDECEPYIDCAGQIYGNAQFDCNGECNGTAKMGDLDANLQQQTTDAHLYVSQILNEAINPTSCNDLNDDSLITVFDAALINACSIYGTNYNIPNVGTFNYCNFPYGILNINDTVDFAIAGINTIDKYIDITIKNPDNEVLAYELTLKGVAIESVISMVTSLDYPTIPEFLLGGNKIICLNYLDSAINKSVVHKPLLRVYYQTIADTVCIEQIVDVVNKDHQQTVHTISEPCKKVIYTGGDIYETLHASLSASPNPSAGLVNIKLQLPVKQNCILKLTDITGRTVWTAEQYIAYQLDDVYDFTSLPAGTYQLTVEGTRNVLNQKIVLVK